LAMALAGYGMPHMMGGLATKSGEHARDPLGPLGLIRAAASLDMAAVEVPLPSDPAVLDEFQAKLRERAFAFIPDYGVILNTTADDFRAYIKASASAGATIVRAMLSPILCGDRRHLSCDWDQHLDRAAQRLREVLPLAEDLGVSIAIENHQDASSADLLRLAEMVDHSPAFGITLDTGNPLAVGEDPVEYARRIRSLLRHVHLKDYTIHFAPNGFRLVRCVAGEGVIDFRAILAITKAQGIALPAIEIAAQQTRTIPILEPDWWDCFPPPDMCRLIPALRILWEKGRPMDEPYASAWERGADSETVCADEWDTVRDSVAYFRQLKSKES
jgi:sugar phosphate isomerase/epimerase